VDPIAVLVVLSALVLATAIGALVISCAIALPRSPRWHPPLTTNDRARLRVQSFLLFARHDERSITLDCTIVEMRNGSSYGSTAPGSPFTLALSPPATTWFSERVEQMLEQWAHEARLVEVEIVEGRSTLQAGISSGSSRVLLELEAAAGLESALR
jgi:hypothetical protein